MPNVIDELVVLLKLNAKQFVAESKEVEKASTEMTSAVEKQADKQSVALEKPAKAAEKTAKVVQAGGKKAVDASKISAADRKRIEDSQAQRAAEREKKQEKQRKDTERAQTKDRKDKERQEKQADREAAKSKEELGDKVKGVALGLAGAFIGFESFMGAVKYLGALNTSTAALGRNSQNLGASAHDLQTWGNAVEQVGGDAKEAQATFGALSQTLTGFKLRGESSPLLQLFQNMGVYVRDAKGNVKDLTVLLTELGAAMQKRGLSRADAFNLAQNAGISEGVFNLLYDKDGKAILGDASRQAYADQGKIDKATRGQRKVENFKQAVKKDVADTFYDFLEHPVDTVVDPWLHPSQNALFNPGEDSILNPAIRATTDFFDRVLGNPVTPADQAAQNSPYTGKLNDTESKYGLPTGLLGRVAYQESHFRPDIISGKTKSSAGAVGLMQLMPEDFPGAGDDANRDIDTAGAYLARLYKQFGSWDKAVAAYNDGPGNMRKILAGKKELPVETQKYVQAVASPGTQNFLQAIATPSVQAVSTPGLAGNTTNTSNGGDSTVNFHGDVNINSNATGGAGVATDFMGAMNRKGVLSQANSGMS